MLAHTIAPFHASHRVGSIVVTASAQHLAAVSHLVRACGFTKVVAVVEGGPTRQDSVRLGLDAVPADAPLVAIHDGARPAVTQEIIHRTLDAAEQYGAAVAAMPTVDTVAISTPDGMLLDTPPRDRVWIVQTPQTFRAELIRRAHRLALQDGFTGTDDASLVSRLGHAVKLVEGSWENLKVTHAEDFARAEEVLARRMTADRSPTAPVRVGIGYDIHRLVEGRALVLCGVSVPHSAGLHGHSDADAATHALMDALLGASGLPDIGNLFPDTDPAYEGARSLDLLRRVVARLAQAGLRPHNADITIVAERPKLASYVPAMRQTLADALGVPVSRVGVKATTNEGLDAVGRLEAIAAHAVATVVPAEVDVR